MQRYILFVLFLCLQWVAQGQTDYEYRYWFDKDEANMQTGTFTPGSLHLDVDLSTLDASLHTIHIQVKDSEGEWSSPVSRYFVRKATALTPLVYWLDNQVEPSEMSAQSGHFDLDVSALDDGIHLLRLQLSQLTEGSSSPVSKFFFKMPLSNQTSLLSWFDSDHENVKKLEYNGGKPFLLDVSEIADGFHVLYLQAMGKGGLSMPTTKMFIKIPQTEGVSYLTCACSVDGKLFKTEQVSSEGGVVNWNLDVASLSQGIHNLQVQVLTPTGAATNVSNHFFFRAVTQKELSNMKLVYSLDGNEFHSATGDAANGVFHFDVDVASLEDGLHRIIYQLASESGASTKVNTSFFWKTPIGGNGITEYRYWLNDNEANAQMKTLDKRVSPFSLVTLLPVDSEPIRSSCFQFEVKDGVPMMYAKNDFHIAFYDASSRRVDETKQFVDYNVSQKVEDIADLQSTQTFTRPEANTVKWYKFEGEKGDTVAFRSSQAMSLQLFAPSGKELYSTSADRSVKYDGCHIWEDGTYYVAAHDVTGTRPNVSLDFMHMDRYDVVAQDVHAVGNGGCSTITFQGNGFRDLYAVDLYTANGDTIHSIDIGHESDASTTATFDFTDAELGNYDALFHFAEEDKAVVKCVDVDEAKEIKLTSTVTYPDVFLRGTSTTYTCKITNKGNMTAYAVPVYIWIKSQKEKGISNVKLEGLDLPKLSSCVSSEVLTEEEVAKLKSELDGLDDDYSFMKFRVEDEDSPNDSICVRSNYFYTNIAPNSTKTIKLTLSTDETDVSAYFTIADEWRAYSNGFTSSINEAVSKRAKSNLGSWYCCNREKIECIANIVCMGLDFGSLFSVPGPTAINITSCVAGIVNQVVTAAGDTYCGTNDVKGDFIKKVNNIVKGINITAAVTSCASAFGVKNASEIVAALDAITHPSVTFNCITAFFEKKPNCPPTPPKGGKSRGVNSLDPNEMYGYLSQAGSKFITDSVCDVNYHIEFENDTTFATASAHVVEIKDTLDSKLFDLASFAPSDIKIGDKTEYLDGTPNFVKTIDMRPAINAIAQVEGKYDQSKGIATWTFTSLDPMTMEPTDDVMQGFLPVNYDGVSGIGEVSYNISLKDKFTDGTEIPNRASIIFDANDPIMTPVWTNTVDAVSPTSQVTGVEQINDSIVRLHFDGSDERSGVWKYELYAQYGEESAWWRMAECNADSSYVDFRFDEGIDYGFCVLATDSAGNVEKKDLTREMAFDTSDPDAVRIVLPSLADGTAVYRGETVSLSCRTNGATIYYTTDGSSPEDDIKRMKYEAPVIIYDNMTIKTIAVGTNGNVSELREYHYSIKQTNQTLTLVPGWNWMSHNKIDELSANELTRGGIKRIMTQTSELFNDPSLGFVGSLSDINPTEAFKVETKTLESINLSGELFNPITGEISLNKGWNWIGYPLSKEASLTDALSLLEAEEGDIISGINGFSQYYQGEWIGTIDRLVPGNGYLFKSLSSKSFLYNETSDTPSKASANRSNLTDKSPWSADVHKYPNMMGITAELYCGDTKAEPNAYYVGAFVGDECRGIGQYINNILFLSVYGDKKTPVRFVAVEVKTGATYEITESVDFVADVIGSIAKPYALHIGTPTSITRINGDNAHGNIYNTKGQKVKIVGNKGIYIINGKKEMGGKSQLPD